MELTDTEIHPLARLSRDRGLYAECKGADLDALQQLGLLQWFDARSSITPFEHDPRPRLEERVFLFIDIEGSTALAERLGEFAFHRLINRFVVDISEQIMAAYGEIHRYVGDKLIASWKLADGVAAAHCV